VRDRETDAVAPAGDQRPASTELVVDRHDQSGRQMFCE
jgi:hypothetical protein